MRAHIRLLRPAEWTKNIFVFAGLAFGNRITDPHSVWVSLLAFAVFCMASSAGYIFNDIVDRHRDRLHPVKKNRPLASGAVSVTAANVVIAILLIPLARNRLRS